MVLPSQSTGFQRASLSAVLVIAVLQGCVDGLLLVVPKTRPAARTTTTTGSSSSSRLHSRHPLAGDDMDGELRDNYYRDYNGPSYLGPRSPRYKYSSMNSGHSPDPRIFTDANMFSEAPWKNSAGDWNVMDLDNEAGGSRIWNSQQLKVPRRR